MPKQTFDEWMRLVNKIAYDTCGLTTEDFTDYEYGEAYECGMTANEAVREALVDAGFPFDEDDDYEADEQEDGQYYQDKYDIENHAPLNTELGDYGA